MTGTSRDVASPTERADLVTAGLLCGLALVVRAGYAAATTLPPFDPWRHLALVRNIREGAGFTLFDGQPYLWYSPVWYYVCALLPQPAAIEWLTAALSALTAPLLFLVARRQGTSRAGAVVTGLLAAAAGPLVAYTVHYGPEALALLLVLAALWIWVATRPRWAAFGAGIAFGVASVLRLNLAFDLFLFWPLHRDRARAAALLSGAALPLLATWWRNHAIIAAHEYVFTWDGLATRSAGFDWLSTLVVQMHPTVQEGLRRLHEQVIPRPEWLWSAEGPAWGSIVFMLVGVACVIAARRTAFVLAAGSAMAYFLIFDSSLSANFFRIYLGVFPVFFLAAGPCIDRVGGASGQRRRTVNGAALVIVLLLAGAEKLRPAPMDTLDGTTAPPWLLTEQRYFVNSGRFHPESLIYRYPNREFVGLPIDPAEWPAVRSLFPEYRAVLWHDFSFQNDVRDRVRQEFALRRRGVNSSGRVYEVYAPRRGRSD